MLQRKWEYNEAVNQLFIDFKKAYDSVMREVFYIILTEFGIPLEPVRLIMMGLNETYSRVCVGKHLSATKMAATYLCAVDIPTNLVSNEIIPCVSIGQCCSSLKEEVQASVNELKSMKVAMRTLEEDLKYVSSTKNGLFADSVCDVNPDSHSCHCCNCIHLENQLKESFFK